MKKNSQKKINIIEDYLLTNGKASVKELSELLNISPEMTRRHLTFLEEKGFLFRTHGGAILRNSNTDIPIAVRLREKTDLKKKLCAATLNYIKNEDCVFVDPSSTLLHLGVLMKLKKNLIVVTNCFDFLNVVKETNHNIFFLGGKYSGTGNRTEGQFQLSMIEKFSFDVAFFGTDGVYALNGPGTQSNDAIFLNENVINRSKLNILVFDSSKFRIISKYCYANFSAFDVMITDKVPDEWKGKINIPVIIETDLIE